MNSNDLKEIYFFILDLFIPENGNLHLKEFKIIDKKSALFFPEFFIYPLDYKGFFNDKLYFLLKREDFLFRDKLLFLEKIKEYAARGAENIFSLNFKKLNLKIGPILDEFNPRENYLLLKYASSGCGHDILTFYCLITAKFLSSFLEGLLNEKNAQGYKNIFDILSALKLRLYRDSITSFWDLNNFVNALDAKDVQLLLNLLLKNNIAEETMITGFIAGINDLKIKAKLLGSLSKNVREIIQNNLVSSGSDKRWIEESSYLIRTGIEKLIFDNRLNIPYLNYIHRIKERIKEERYFKIFRDKSYESFIEESDKNGLIEKIGLITGRKTLLLSLKNCKEKTINYFLKNLSLNARIKLMEDMRHYHDSEGSEDKVFQSRIMVMEGLKALTCEKKAENMIGFKDIILNLNPLNLNLLIEETGVINFVQATMNEGKDIKKYIINSVRGIVKYFFVDLYSGKIRFKQGFGEITINRNKKEILKTYYFLKDSGKMI